MKADALSCCLDFDTGNSLNEHLIVLPLDCFKGMPQSILQALSIPSEMSLNVLEIEDKSFDACHRLSKQPNCFRGTCSGLVTWWTRCTADASSGMRHIVLTPPLLLIVIAVVLLNGGVSPMMPALSMTHAFVLVLVPFPQLSPHIRSYCPIIPNPCTLG